MAEKRTTRLMATAQQQKRGEEAEKKVAEILHELPKTRFEVFNDVEARYGNVDHLVVSREGTLFLVETKSYRGKITVEDEKVMINGRLALKQFFGQINTNIRWAKELIREKLGVNPWVVSILIFPNGVLYSSKGKRVIRLPPVKRINIVSPGRLRRLIQSYSPRTQQRRIWANRELFKTHK